MYKQKHFWDEFQLRVCVSGVFKGGVILGWLWEDSLSFPHLLSHVLPSGLFCIFSCRNHVSFLKIKVKLPTVKTKHVFCKFLFNTRLTFYLSDYFWQHAPSTTTSLVFPRGKWGQSFLEEKYFHLWDMNHSYYLIFGVMLSCTFLFWCSTF